MTQSVPSSAATIVMVPPPFDVAVSHGVLDERLQGEERHDDVQDPKRDMQSDVECVAEARALERQVAVDVAQFVGENRVFTGRAEGVLVKSAKSRTSSRARSGSVRTNEAMVLSAL